MTRQPSISVTVLRQALEGKRAEIRALEAEAAELQGAIDQLQGFGGNSTAEQFPVRQFSEPTIIDSETAAKIVDFQERAVEDDKTYPPEEFSRMSRIEIAISLAESFNGFVATSAYRKVLSKPGVRTRTRQIGSVASRVLAHSSRFRRCWEGLYRLQSPPTNGRVPVQEAAQPAH